MKMTIKRLLAVVLGSFIVLAFGGGVQLLAAGPMDKVVEFYSAPLPNAPKIDTDVVRAMEVAETGDIVIENNRAYPQWYVAIAFLVPNTKYVHGEMVVKGHVLSTLEQTFAKIGKRSPAFFAYRRQQQDVQTKKGLVKVWKCLPITAIDPSRPYVITPEVTGNEKLSAVVALDMEDYLIDPALGYPYKHVKILRAPVKNQAAINRVVRYLVYHLSKKTLYDMGFAIDEQEPAVRRHGNGRITFDLTVAPVPIYCTELILRALGEAGDFQFKTTLVNPKLVQTLSRIPKVTMAFFEKVTKPVCDCRLFHGWNRSRV
mgnify:CR=1 FL=1